MLLLTLLRLRPPLPLLTLALLLQRLLWTLRLARPLLLKWRLQQRQLLLVLRLRQWTHLSTKRISLTQLLPRLLHPPVLRTLMFLLLR
jgi:hypothetical protein